jgi:uncharacterized protein YukE
MNVPSIISLQMLHAASLTYEEAAVKVTPDLDPDEAVLRVRKLDLILSEQQKESDAITVNIKAITERDRQEREERDSLRINLRKQARQHLERLEKSWERQLSEDHEDEYAASHSSRRMYTSIDRVSNFNFRSINELHSYK